MVTKIYIEDNLIDLFDDETIELNVSIANTDDITKINSDYTKTFTVPASDRNNYIFKHFYDADIDNTFDARTKKNAKIELDGLPFKIGKMRLDKVSVKNNKPSAYTINFWGDLVNFKLLLKEDELSVLDFSAYNHEYNYATVREGLINGLFDRDIVYNLITSKKIFVYDSSEGGQFSNDTYSNLAFRLNPFSGFDFNELKPSIRLLPIIEAIEAKYNITFTRDFFGRPEFTELYMWASKSATPITYRTEKIEFLSGDDDFMSFTTFIATFTPEFTDSLNRKKYSLELFVDTGALDFRPYTINVYKNGVIEYSETRSNDQTFTYEVETLLATETVEYYFEIESKENPIVYSAVLTQREKIYVAGVLTQNNYVSNAPINVVALEVDIAREIPKIKIIDFLKGIFMMHKCVVISQPNGDIYVNTIDDYYKEGSLYDITNKIDFESYDVERGKINNKLDFKYQPPTTILNNQFKINTTVAYGDEVLDLADDNGTPLDGEKLEVTLPFEQILFERLTNDANDLLTNVQIGTSLQPDLAPANPKPVIFYNNVVQLSGTDITIKDSIGLHHRISTTVNTPSHTLGFDNPQFSTLWGVEFSTWNYQAMYNTLFSNYWRNYVSSIFNIKRRTFKYKATLPIPLLTKLELNDILKIKERYYRINDFTVNLLTGGATLNLINTFENNFGLFSPSQTSVYLNYKAQEYSVYVSNGSVMNIVLQDLGYGTTWATVIQDGNFIKITVTENVLINNRDLYINVDNTAGKSFQIYLNQDNKVVTFDSTDITFDNDILTFDAN